MKSKEGVGVERCRVRNIMDGENVRTSNANTVYVSVGADHIWTCQGQTEKHKSQQNKNGPKTSGDNCPNSEGIGPVKSFSSNWRLAVGVAGRSIDSRSGVRR